MAARVHPGAGPTDPALDSSVPDGQLEQGVGVGAGASKLGAPVQMGPGGAARAADGPDDRAALDQRTLGHVRPIEVHVERVESLAVVARHALASKEEVDDEGTPSPIRGYHGRPGRHRKVESGMGRAWLSVDDAPRAEALTLRLGGSPRGVTYRH